MFEKNIRMNPSAQICRDTVIEYPLDLPFDRAYISGLHYYDFPLVRRAIKTGDKLTLKREPDNPHDTYAVEVYFCGRKLGYWPYPNNKALANTMDEGNRLKAKVLEINQNDREIYEALKVEAFIDFN
jgi:hypothetical protein